MKLSACITLNERPITVLDTVFSSMLEQSHDDFLIVLDRSPDSLSDYCKNWWKKDNRTRFVEIKGEPGWKSPVKAWNVGFKNLDCDFLYCFSSDTVQAKDNIGKSRKMLYADPKTIIFGKCECSCGPNGGEVNWGGMAPGNLFCNSTHPRPLGFIWAGPMKPVNDVGGFDEKFSDGFWYDENSFFYSLWRQGLDFAFDDSVSGIHLHHERPELTQEGIRRNAAYMAGKHGTLDPLGGVLHTLEARPGRTVWRHI